MFKTGYAERDVTPSVGSQMSCFPIQGEPRIIEGIHDPLKIRALSLFGASESAVICSCDLTLINNDDVMEIRRRAAPLCGIAEDHIMINCVHSHSSGENTLLFGGSRDDAWPTTVREAIIEAIVDSARSASSATVEGARIDAPFNHNRRVLLNGKWEMVFDRDESVTTGPTDPTLSALRFRPNAGPPVVWVNWTAHALTVGRTSRLISADYPGALSSMLSERLGDGTHVMVTNGCAGNVHPMRSMKEGFDVCDEIGSKLAGAAARALDNATSIDAENLAVRSTTLHLQRREDPEGRVDVTVALLSLGDWAIGFLPGEPYVEFQLAFREAAPSPNAFINGYANGWVGYIPTQEAFEQGGYGVDFYPKDPKIYSRTQIKPGDGETIRDALIKLSE